MSATTTTTTTTRTATPTAMPEADLERKPSIPLSRGLKIEDLASGEQAMTSKPMNLFSMGALSHAVSGSVGGNVAMLAFYPLDQLVIRAQAATGSDKSGCAGMGPFRAMMHVISTEGVAGLYRGLYSTLFTLFVANFIYFYAFHLMRMLVRRNKYMRNIGQRLKISRALSNLLLGTIAGAINVLFVQPLWVANARLKLEGDQYKGVVDVVLRIIKEEGYQKLWAGVSSSLLLCSNPAIQFAVYETIKKVLTARKGSNGKEQKLSSLEAFLLGAFAKWIATVATYPLQVAQTRLRRGKGSQSIEYRGTFDCLYRMYKAEGRRGLYRGMETKLWHSTLISALMFLSYEKIQLAVERVIKGDAARRAGTGAYTHSPASTPSSSPGLAPAGTGAAGGAGGTGVCRAPPLDAPQTPSLHPPPMGPRSRSSPSPPPLQPLTSTTSYHSLSDFADAAERKVKDE